MPTLLELARKIYNSNDYDWGGPGEGSGPYDGTRDIDANKKLDIDCSHLVNNILNAAGYKIPYLTTSELNHSAQASDYFDEISLQEATENDLVLFPHHVGIYSKFDAANKVGEYFGSQSKGPGIARFDEKGTYGWKMNFVILRPKKELVQKVSISAPNKVQQLKRWSKQSTANEAPRWRLEADADHLLQPDSHIRWIR